MLRSEVVHLVPGIAALIFVSVEGLPVTPDCAATAAVKLGAWPGQVAAS